MIEASEGLNRARHAPEVRFSIRSFAAEDARGLSRYFGGLPDHERYNRFLGAVAAPSAADLAGLALPGLTRCLVALDGGRQIIGEVRYAFDDATDAVEVALSVAGDARGEGVGAAMLGRVEQYAAAANMSRIFGDTLRTNAAMLPLAKRLGFSFTHPPGDWTLVRFERLVLDPQWVLPVAQSPSSVVLNR